MFATKSKCLTTSNKKNLIRIVMVGEVFERHPLLGTSASFFFFFRPFRRIGAEQGELYPSASLTASEQVG